MPPPSADGSRFQRCVVCFTERLCRHRSGVPGPVALQLNGATWSSASPQDPYDDSILNAVSCVTSTFCMAAGTESFVVSGGSRRLNGSVTGLSEETGSPDRPLVASWDGSRWTMQYPPRGPHRKADYDLNGVHAHRPRRVWWSGPMTRMDEDTRAYRWLIVSRSGRSWNAGMDAHGRSSTLADSATCKTSRAPRAAAAWPLIGTVRRPPAGTGIDGRSRR